MQFRRLKNFSVIRLMFFLLESRLFGFFFAISGFSSFTCGWPLFFSRRVLQFRRLKKYRSFDLWVLFVTEDQRLEAMVSRS